MRIAVLGAGNIGGTLGAKWAAAGHEVVWGVRDPASPKVQARISESGNQAKAASVASAIEFGEIIVFALPNTAMAATLGEHGAALKSKIVIDTTNKFGAPIINSLAEIRAAAPEAIIYRAFNSLGWENFAQPQINGTQIDLLFCGPNTADRATIERLIADVGLAPVYVGDLNHIQAVDAVGLLWAALAFGQGTGRRLAFKTLIEKEQV